jgi:hypothetical protein
MSQSYRVLEHELSQPKCRLCISHRAQAQSFNFISTIAFSHCVAQWRQCQCLVRKRTPFSMSHCTIAMTTRPCAQAHAISMSRCTMATTTWPCAQAHAISTSRCTTATTTRPHAQAHAISTSRCTKATTTTRKRLQHHHISTTSPWCNSAQAVSYRAPHDGDDNNKNSNNKSTRTTKCASAPGFQPLCTSAQATASNISRCNNQPGNIKHRHAQATVSFIDAAINWPHQT